MADSNSLLPDVPLTGKRATIALSLLVHGEAVRFNRGKARGEDFDFKYMKGRDGREYPYVSSQCFKKYWREALPTPPSPITREKDAKGQEKNQAYTSGNPFEYVDDDLFGYMIAGAGSENEEAQVEGEVQGVEDVDAALEAFMFTSDDIKDGKGLLARLKDGSALSVYLLGQMNSEVQDGSRAASVAEEPSEAIVAAIVAALNEAVKDIGLVDQKRIQVKGQDKKIVDSGKAESIQPLNRKLLLKAFSKELAQEEKKKRATTKRTSPVRMHALVAFSGIKTAKDFQTFSRDVALSGKNSILNPNPVGLYSGWLKTRVLIEAYRIGKFYAGANLDLLNEQTQGKETREEVNPYDRTQAKVTFVQLSPEQRRERLSLALKALADVGNNQGPASGALHDGSLKPKAFIGGVLDCADSPFDAVWQGTAEHPRLDLHRLQAVLDDWNDLFLDKRIYVGLPIETMFQDDVLQDNAMQESGDAVKNAVERIIQAAGFVPVVGTPRKTLLQFAQDAPLIAIPEEML